MPAPATHPIIFFVWLVSFVVLVLMLTSPSAARPRYVFVLEFHPCFVRVQPVTALTCFVVAAQPRLTCNVRGYTVGDPFFRWTELDTSSFPEWRDHIVSFEPEGDDHEPRTYPGHPRWQLPAVRARLWPSLDRVLRRRRRHDALATVLPSPRTLSRLLRHAHGVTASLGRGPVPSAGGLQALELYLVSWNQGWLPPGVYHFDRAGSWLSQVVRGAELVMWRELVPSLALVQGGALLWVFVGDGRRVARKYAERGYRFLLMEAGHLMQNLCLMSESLGLCTVPLGGFLERDIARRMNLPVEDLVLYVAVCGAAL